VEGRFEDTRDQVDSFMDETLVVCPQCSGRAISRRRHGESPAGWFVPRRLVCDSCSFVKDWASNGIERGWYRAHDDYFDLPLWLQTPCCGGTLWAYNERHLEFLEAFVGARLRERVRDGEHGWSNKSLASRLPSWMKAAKNRDEVRKGLGRLRSRLQEGVG
jgi:hypothetical protein